MSDPALVHIYGQSVPQDSVHIVGNREGLLLLKAAIEAALLGGRHEVEVCVNDGEGFDIRAVMLDSSWNAAQWTNLSLPYSDSTAMEQRVNALWPWTFWSDSV